MHCVKFLTIKPTGCTNFLNLFLEWNSTGFGQFLCPSSGVFHCTPSNGICHKGLLTAVPSWSCLQAVSKLYDIYHCCVYSKKLLMMDRGTVWNMYSKNKFEKLVHLVGSIIRISIDPFFHYLMYITLNLKYGNRTMCWSVKSSHGVQSACFSVSNVKLFPGCVKWLMCKHTHVINALAENAKVFTFIPPYYMHPKSSHQLLM
jgi:hypothetical protein